MSEGVYIPGSHERQPTEAEIKEMEKRAKTIGVIELTTKALGAFLDKGMEPKSALKLAKQAAQMGFAEAMSRSDTFESNDLVKLRNSIAIDIVFKMVNEKDLDSSIKHAFNLAESVINDSKKHVEDEA